MSLLDFEEKKGYIDVVENIQALQCKFLIDLGET